MYEQYAQTYDYLMQILSLNCLEILNCNDCAQT